MNPDTSFVSRPDTSIQPSGNPPQPYVDVSRSYLEAHALSIPLRYFSHDRFPVQASTDETHRLFLDPMHSPLLGVRMDHPFRDPYTPSEDGRTPPFSNFPSPSQLAPDDGG